MKYMREEFKSIDDPELARDMANASTYSRTQEAREKRAEEVYEKESKTFWGRVDHLLSLQSPGQHASLARLYAQDAEWKEDQVEVKHSVEKEIAGLSDAEIIALRNKAMAAVNFSKDEAHLFSNDVRRAVIRVSVLDQIIRGKRGEVKKVA